MPQECAETHFCIKKDRRSESLIFHDVSVFGLANTNFILFYGDIARSIKDVLSSGENNHKTMYGQRQRQQPLLHWSYPWNTAYINMQINKFVCFLGKKKSFDMSFGPTNRNSSRYFFNVMAFNFLEVRVMR